MIVTTFTAAPIPAPATGTSRPKLTTPLTGAGTTSIRRRCVPLYWCRLSARGVSASVGQAGARIGEKVAVAALKRLPGATLTKINRAVGSRLLTKFGTTTIDALFPEQLLPEILEEAARLGAQLLMQAAPEDSSYRWS
ncbi:Conserved protein of unknown function [Mycobacterium canettii CIPT 140070010]|nr:Conserved protein of unknown function [Mycobacterium canettii CIPT 140070010]